MKIPTIRGIGIDAVAIDRMDVQRMGMHVLTRMFHHEEILEMQLLPQEQRKQYLASRFAAKEAFVKALGTGFRGISPREILVKKNSHDRPSLELDSDLRTRLGLEQVHIHLSITHEGALAMAFVILEDGDGKI